MKAGKLWKKLDKTLLFLVVLVLIAAAATFWKGRWQLLFSGFKQTANIFKSMWFRILLGITFGGFIQVLIPGPLVAEWLGPASGLKGILIGSYVGIIMSGPPFVMLPIIASIYKAGAGVGPIIALLTGQGLIGLEMLIVWQIPFFGVELPLARYIVSLFIPPFAGLVGAAVFRLMTRSPQVSSKTANNGQPDDVTDAVKAISEKEEEA